MTMLSPENMRTVLAHLSRDRRMSLERAARAIGASKGTIMEWLRRSRADPPDPALLVAWPGVKSYLFHEAVQMARVANRKDQSANMAFDNFLFAPEPKPKPRRIKPEPWDVDIPTISGMSTPPRRDTETPSPKSIGFKGARPEFFSKPPEPPPGLSAIQQAALARLDLLPNTPLVKDARARIIAGPTNPRPQFPIAVGKPSDEPSVFIPGLNRNPRPLPAPPPALGANGGRPMPNTRALAPPARPLPMEREDGTGPGTPRPGGLKVV